MGSWYDGYLDASRSVVGALFVFILVVVVAVLVFVSNIIGQMLGVNVTYAEQLLGFI